MGAAARRETTIASDHAHNPPPIELGEPDPEVQVVSDVRASAIELEAFMAEQVLIEIATTTDKNASPIVQLGVQGRMICVPRGERVYVKRMYVERLARARSTTFEQDLDPRLGEGVNKLTRRRALDYPFQVIQDSAKGHAWLKGILAEP